MMIVWNRLVVEKSAVLLNCERSVKYLNLCDPMVRFFDRIIIVKYTKQKLILNPSYSEDILSILTGKSYENELQ